MHLRQRHVALVDDGKIILGKEVEQAERPRPLRTPVEVSRVVLDARAVAQLLYHFEVVLDALLYALRLHHAALLFEEGYLLAQIEIYLLHGAVYALLRGNEQIGRIERKRIERTDALPRYGVDAMYGLDLVVEEHHAETLAAELAECGHDIHRVACDAESTGFEVALGTRVERLDEPV